MKEKWLWLASLLVLGGSVSGFVLVRLLWDGAPDAVVRALGVVTLIALPVFAFATVKLAGKKNCPK